MMARALGLAIALAWGLPATARADMSVTNYLLLESGQVEVDPRYTYVYVSGVLDALTAFNEAMRSAGISLFCPLDDQPGIEIDAFKALIDRAIERDKASARISISMRARRASGSSGSGS
jgi:hypothetical protein